jgi:hypothetical protein
VLRLLPLRASRHGLSAGCCLQHES